MRPYTIYFTIYGKKLKMKIYARSKGEAKLLLRAKIEIIIDKVEEVELPETKHKPTPKDPLERLRNILHI